MAEVNPNAIWDDERVTQLELLDRLLKEVSAIDRANNCLARIEKCIELADALIQTDYRGRKGSFLGFLNDICIKDRFPEKGAGNA